MDARQHLQEDAEQTTRRLADLTRDFDSVVAASRDSNADDEHDPEGATIAFEREQVGALVAQGEHHLAEIAAALERLDADTYGICEKCGQAIAAERLEVRPVARTCVACAGS